LQYDESGSNINVNTTSGKTEIKLPENAGFHLDYKTNSGSGKCDIPITVSGTQKRNNLEGTVVSDSNSVNVSSTSAIRI